MRFASATPHATVRVPSRGALTLGGTTYRVIRSLSTKEQIKQGRAAIHAQASNEQFVLKWSTVRDVLIYEANVGAECFAASRTAVVPEPVALFADPKRDWLVQRYVAFVPLYRRIREPAFDLARYMTNLCTALGELQTLGFVHRDMHSGNVGTRGEQPVIIDFGMSVVRHEGAVYGADDSKSVYAAASAKRDATSRSLDLLCLTASMLPFLSSSVAFAPRRMHAMLNSALSAATSQGAQACFVEPHTRYAARAFHFIAYQYAASTLIAHFVPAAFAIELNSARLDIEIAQSRSEAHTGAANNFLAVLELTTGPITRTRFIGRAPNVGVVRVGADGVRAVANGRCTARTVCEAGPVDLHARLPSIVRRFTGSAPLDVASCALLHCTDDDGDVRSVVVFAHGGRKYMLDSTATPNIDAADIARARSAAMEREAVFASIPLAWAPVGFAGLDELVSSGSCAELTTLTTLKTVGAFVAAAPSSLYSD